MRCGITEIVHPPTHPDVKAEMKASHTKMLVWFALVVGAGLLATSCASTNEGLGGGLVEKGSARGGASQLMKP